MKLIRTVALPFAVAAGLAAAPLVYSMDSTMLDDPLYQELPPGEFVLGNGDDKTILHAKSDKHYRICGGKGSIYDRKAQIPINVVHDGVTSVVMPGDCIDVEAKQIKIKPGGKLEDDYVLTGKYHRMR